jgi:FAD dependent oxidoreductase TIGR03364
VRDERRGARLVDPGELARLAPIPIAGVLGGVHAELDLRVDPRTAASALARLLEDDPGARVHWRTAAQTVDRGEVKTSRGTIRADAVVVCPGPDLDTLFPGSLAPLTRCALQMLRVAAPHGRRYRPALLTGLSLLRYPGFREADPQSHARIAARVATESAALAAAGVHLIATQRADGDLILGDTHAYATTVDPFRDEALDELLLALARELLGASELRVRERWQGVYPVIPGESFHVVSPAPAVRVVEVVSGIGMTTSFGLAEHVLDGLLASI